MSYYILHKDGQLVGVSPFVESTQLDIPGVSMIAVDGEVPDLNTSIWDIDTLSLISNKAVFSKLEFLSRFTMQERIAISMSTDPIVADIMKLFDAAEYIDTMNLQTQQGVGYLSYVGILTSQRVMEVLSA